jgi:hypothetical protein
VLESTSSWAVGIAGAFCRDGGLGQLLGDALAQMTATARPAHTALRFICGSEMIRHGHHVQIRNALVIALASITEVGLGAAAFARRDPSRGR